MKTTAEMNAIFGDVPEALDNTVEICGKVESYTIDHAPIMPTFAIPEEFGTEGGVSPQSIRRRICSTSSRRTRTAMSS